MYDGDAEVPGQDCGQDLSEEWPTVWPQVRRRDDRGQQWDRRDAGQDEGFVDCDVDAVAGAVGAIVVPFWVIRNDPLYQERRGDRGRQDD